MECPLCGSSNTELLATIKKRPQVEIDYQIPVDLYFREVYQCQNCLVYFNSHELLDLDTFYDGYYNQSVEPLHTLTERFNRLINIPFEKSDNKQRVRRFYEKVQELFIHTRDFSVLDVGSGTCVFLYELLKLAPIEAYCVDPDPNTISHIQKNIPEIHATAGTLSQMADGRKFDVITFNKVLEHVKDSPEQLRQAKLLLKDPGFIYLELPFGDDIAKSKTFSENAEFNVEHITIHNFSSIQYLASESGFSVVEIKSIRDPSGKHTIYAFLKKVYE